MTWPRSTLIFALNVGKKDVGYTGRAEADEQGWKYNEHFLTPEQKQ